MPLQSDSARPATVASPLAFTAGDTERLASQRPPDDSHRVIQTIGAALTPSELDAPESIRRRWATPERSQGSPGGEGTVRTAHNLNRSPAEPSQTALKSVMDDAPSGPAQAAATQITFQPKAYIAPGNEPDDGCDMCYLVGVRCKRCLAPGRSFNSLVFDCTSMEP